MQRRFRLGPAGGRGAGRSGVAVVVCLADIERAGGVGVVYIGDGRIVG